MLVDYFFSVEFAYEIGYRNRVLALRVLHVGARPIIMQDWRPCSTWRTRC